MERMKFERLDHEGLWISGGGDPVTRLFLSTNKRKDMPQIKSFNARMDEKKAKARTADGGYFELDL